jgi:hypothetical protein
MVVDLFKEMLIITQLPIVWHGYVHNELLKWTRQGIDNLFLMAGGNYEKRTRRNL